jgi:UDP-hydrolysing UDP-N-acetyl-D-glucosamine 2-epimerase
VRRIGVVSVARSDYGLLRPILRRLHADPAVDLFLIAAAAHLSPEFGKTVALIESDGFPVAARVEMTLSSDSPEGIAKSISLGVGGFAQVYATAGIDLLLILGDRFEMLAATLAAAPFRTPVAHLHGGELTFGAIDEAFRHAITKMSHLHLVSNAEHARRVIQMGEAPWRVTVTGAPGIDAIIETASLDDEEFKARYGFRLPPEYLLVTFHPATLEYERAGDQCAELLAALDAIKLPVLFTMPNADTAGRTIRRMILEALPAHPEWRAVENLSTPGYLTAMRRCAAMVGNTSSGILEAPSVGAAVVNIGSRQAGRARAASVIDVGSEREAILEGIRRALAPEFRAMARQAVNPYGDGRASERIVARLKEVSLGPELTYKVFHDLEAR